jgi:hypothetical protein
VVAHEGREGRDDESASDSSTWMICSASSAAAVAAFAIGVAAAELRQDFILYES